MSTVDDMKVVITSDTTGVDVGFDKLVKSATKTLKGISSQTIDWNNILTGDFSPAILDIVGGTLGAAIGAAIAGIGAVVAPTTAFQSAVNQTGTAAGETSTQIDQMSQSALAMSEQVTPSATDLFTAMTQVAGIFGSGTQATTDITQAMAQLSDAGFGPLNDIVSSSMDLFRQYGVTTEAGAIQMLTDLMHGAQTAKEPLATLADQFSTFATQLAPGQKTLQSFNGDISAYGAAVQTLTASGAASIMDVIGSSSQNAAGPAEKFGISIQTINQALTSGNLAGLLQTVSGAIAKFPPTAALTILTPAEYSAFQNLSQNQMPVFLQDTQEAATSAESIQQAFQQSDSFLRQLILDWNTLKAGLTIAPGSTGGLSSSMLNAVTVGDNSPNWTGVTNPNWTTGGQAAAVTNNNPGDLKFAGQAGATESPGGFAQFATFADGFQALENQLSTLIANHPNATLQDIIQGGGTAGNYSGYAPLSDGNPADYASNVASLLGVNVKTPIDQLSLQLQNFASAIGTQEDHNNPNLPPINSTKTVSLTNFFTINNPGAATSTAATAIAQQIYNSFQGIQ